VLVAGSTRDPQRQQLFYDKRGNKPIYGDYQKMLQQECPNIVSIATPATCHAEMVIAAAEAGVKGIYCEKAMATSLVECDAMIESCKRSGTVLAINYTRRWDDRFRFLQRLIAEKTIGEIQSIQISYGGGRLCRVGSHMSDLALMFGGDEVVGCSGWLSNADEFDPGGVGLFETRGGMRIVIDGSVGMTQSFNMAIVGETGLVRLLDGEFSIELWSQDETSEFGLLSRRHLPLNYPVGNPMLNAIDDLIVCMEEGGTPKSNGESGRDAFELIAAIYQSHRQHRAFVTLPLEDRGLVIPSN
jgi:UDP-N-acetyl-2-amino-2-deoxyglucuronate dehydrogenase